jgi:hypothetical protein
LTELAGTIIRERLKQVLRPGWRVRFVNRLHGEETAFGSHEVILVNPNMGISCAYYLNYHAGFISKLDQVTTRLKELEDEQTKKMVDAL